MDRDYKTMTDVDLMDIMADFRCRVGQLKSEVCVFLDGNGGCAEENRLKREYASLKKDVREIAAYLGLKRNKFGSKDYTQKFSFSFVKAASCFRAKSNGSIAEMAASLAEVCIELEFYEE